MNCYFLSRPVDEEGKPVREYRRITKFGIKKHRNFKNKNIQKYTQ